MNNPFSSIFGFILLAFTLFVVTLWIISTLKIIRITGEAQLSLRGIIKHYAYKRFNESSNEKVKQFLLITLILWIIPNIWSALLFWKTDQSFLVFLFPIFWYFFAARFLVWEKKDILLKHAKSKKKKDSNKDKNQIEKNN